MVSQIFVKSWNAEYTVCLEVYETKEILDLYFSNQTRWNTNYHCAIKNVLLLSIQINV